MALNKILLTLLFTNIAIGQNVIEQYQVHELQFTGQSYNNPYQSVRFYAHFDGPGEASFDIEGFWNGDSTWNIRVALTEVGTWTYQTTSNDSLLDNQTGTIECVASDRRGFLTTSGQHFYYQDGTPVFRMGDTCWRGFRSKNADYDSLFVPYIDARAAQGFNYLMSVVHTVGDSSINEGGNLWPRGNLDYPNPNYFEWIDKRVEYANSKGITVGMLFVWAQTFEDFTRDQFSRFRRYIVGRYAAYDVVWIISGEYTERCWPEDYHYHADIIKHGSDYDAGDPYDHPISIHPSGNETNTQDYDLFHTWLGFVMQQYYGSPSLLHSVVTSDRAYGLPVATDEFGYEGPTDPGDPAYYSSNQTPDEIRKDAWTIAMSGGYFTYGNIYTYTGKERIIDLSKLQTPGAQYMGELKTYLTEKVPYFELSPMNSCVLSGEGYCMAKADSLYLVYMPGSGDVEINLQSTEPLFQATWYRPSTQDSLSGGFVQGAQSTVCSNPFSDDALLILDKYHDPVAQIRVFLEGAYDSTGQCMSTHLADSSLIPGQAPYPEDTCSVTSVSDSTTDWILLELYETLDGPAGYSKSVLLRRDGYLVSNNGQTPYIGFPDSLNGSYYLSIHHRNHYSVKSASTISLAPDNIASYDFTDSESKYSTSQYAKEVDSNVWAIRCGDLDKNGAVEEADISMWRQSAENGDSGYVNADVNLDSHTTTEDYTLMRNNQ